MTGIEDGQRKFEDFNRGGGIDYRPNIKEFKRDDRGNKTIPETMECLSHIKPPPVKVKVCRKWKPKKIPDRRLDEFYNKQ